MEKFKLTKLQAIGLFVLLTLIAAIALSGFAEYVQRKSLFSATVATLPVDAFNREGTARLSVFSSTSPSSTFSQRLLRIESTSACVIPKYSFAHLSALSISVAAG